MMDEDLHRYIIYFAQVVYLYLGYEIRDRASRVRKYLINRRANEWQYYQQNWRPLPRQGPYR